LPPQQLAPPSPALVHQANLDMTVGPLLGEGARLGQRRATDITSASNWATALTSGLVASSPSTSRQGLPCSTASTARRPNSPLVSCKAGSHASGAADSISQGATATPSMATSLRRGSTTCWLSTNGMPLTLQYGTGSFPGTALPQGVSINSSPGSAATAAAALTSGNSASSVAAGPQPSPQPLPNPPGSPVRTFRHVHGLFPPAAAGNSASTVATQGRDGASGTSCALPGTPLQCASTASWPGCSVSPHRDQAHTAKRSSAEPPPPQLWPAVASTGTNSTSAGGNRVHPMQVGGRPMPTGGPSTGAPTAAGCSSGSAPGGVMPVLAASGSGTPLPPFPCQASPRAVFGRASAAAALAAAPPPPILVAGTPATCSAVP